MYCPECKAEYREGIARCVECDVPLVAELEHELVADSEEGEKQELISIFESTDSALLSDVVARVESAGVPYLLQSGTAFEYPAVPESLTWRGVLWIPADETEDVRAMVEEAKKAIETSAAAEDPAAE